MFDEGFLGGAGVAREGQVQVLVGQGEAVVQAAEVAHEDLATVLPGMGQLKQLSEAKPDEKQLGRVEAILSSMTPEERKHDGIINGSRRKRIAKGSGTSVEEVNRLLKQFVQMQKMMKQLGGMAALGGGGKNARRRAMEMLRNRR